MGLYDYRTGMLQGAVIAGMDKNDRLAMQEALERHDSYMCTVWPKFPDDRHKSYYSTIILGGPSPAAVAALFDNKRRQVTHCVIGKPGSDRFWYTQNGGETCKRGLTTIAGMSGVHFDLGPTPIEWDNNRELDMTCRIFVNATNADLEKIVSILRGKTNIFRGPDAVIHIGVLTSTQPVAGSICAATNEPTDLTSALLVKQAGGFVQGFRKSKDGLNYHDGLDIFGCHYVVTAKSQRILNSLSEKLLTAYKT